MFWFILLAISIIAVIVGGVLYKCDVCEKLSLMLIVFGAFVAIIVGLAVPIKASESASSISTFKEQKEYIESHVSKSDIEDAALTTEKIELNGWLYKVQYEYRNYTFFTLYSSEVLELEEIQ